MRLLSLLPVFLFPLTFALHVNITERGITRTSASLGLRSDELGHALQQRQLEEGVINLDNDGTWGYVSHMFGFTTDLGEALKVELLYLGRPEDPFTIKRDGGHWTHPYVAAITTDWPDLIFLGGSALSTLPGENHPFAPNTHFDGNMAVQTSIFFFEPPFSSGALKVEYFSADGVFRMPKIQYHPGTNRFFFYIPTISGSGRPSATHSFPNLVDVTWIII